MPKFFLFKDLVLVSEALCLRGMSAILLSEGEMSGCVYYR